MKRLLGISVVLAALAIAATTGTARANDEGGGGHCRHVPLNVVVGTLGSDRLVGTPCADLIYGLNGADVLIGRGGSDTLRGGRGDDRIRGVDGEPDLLAGGRGTDVCVGDQFDSFTGCEATRLVFLF